MVINMKWVKMIRELFKYLKGFKMAYVTSFLFTLIYSGSSIAVPFLVLKIFDIAIGTRSYTLLFIYVFAIILTTIIGSISQLAYQKSISKMNRTIVKRVRMNCIMHLNNLSGDFFSNYSSGDLYSVLFNDIEMATSIVTTSMFNFITNAIMAVGLAFFLLNLQADLLAILIISQITLFFVQKVYVNKIEKVTENTRTSIGKLNSSAQEFIFNLFAFCENNLFKYFSKLYIQVEDEFAESNQRASYTMTQNSISLNLLNSITVAAILCYGGIKVIIGSLTIGGLVTFNLYSQRFVGPITQMAQFHTEITKCSVSWKRIINLLDIQTNVHSGMLTENIDSDLEFKNVSFAYEKNKLVFNGLTLNFKKGKVNAVVGLSGAGKTSMIHLLYRLWDADSGNILINGHDIREFDLGSLRNQISIVSQNIFLLNDTIRNNIILEKKDVSEQHLKMILKKADILNFIKSLPDGLETMVGENGIKLSGGERQRISIARAMLRESPVLVFDEATSMLDNNTEDTIISQMLQSFEMKTVILIAHRLSTVIHSDKIFMLNYGKIVEQGSHAELMEKKGEYYALQNTKEM